MRLGALEIRWQKQILKPLAPLSGRGGWYPAVVREPYMGAWQKNDPIVLENVLAYSAVFACVTLIAGDISKQRLRLVEEDANGIWTPTENPAYSPVLRKPNRYQNRIKFVQQWMISLLTHGNTYVLKQRDARGVVVALYILEPTRVTVLVAPDGSVYYQLKRDDLSGLPENEVIIPAQEIIHDLMIPLFHPLIGVSPIFASALAATEGLAIQSNSSKFFESGSHPGGILSVPEQIDDATAQRVADYWNANFTGEKAGRVAVVGGGMTFHEMTMRAVDAQLIEQLKWTSETVCSTFHVPPYMIGVGPPPNYNNIEALNQQYYSQCLQVLMESMELALDEGLELKKPFGTEFDIDDLLRMDTPTKTKAAADSIGSGGMAPNEARFKYFDLPPVEGGETPYMQNQNYSLSALAERDRDKPFAKPEPAPAPEEAPEDEEEEESDEEEENEEEEVEAASFAAILHQKSITGGLYAG